MSAAFNLTAQLNLIGPNNVKKIVSDIKKQLGTVQGKVNLNINASSAKNISKLNAALQSLNTNLSNVSANAASATNAINVFTGAANNVNAATSNAAASTTKVAAATQNLGKNTTVTAKQLAVARTEMQEFGRQSALAIRRFAAFSAVTGIIFSVTGAIRKGIGAFLEFEKSFVAVQQVTGKSGAELKGLNNEVSKLSVGLGISSLELINVAQTLAQAGLSANETQRALKALALSSLAPTFDDLNNTVEGSIALMRQFGISANDLEASLGSVNAVAAAFAVESGDIIGAIQRTGGVFAAASKGVSQGKDALNEFIAVFTSVRQTTRESAETIATGLRTIFTRIQRGDTIEALREFGVELTDAEGKFVGAYKAIGLLSDGLGRLDPRDVSFSRIVEELGGFRQIGKVIPLIQQFAVAQEALKVAQGGQGSLAKDAITAQLSLGNQIAKVREEFLAFVRDVGSGDTFQTLAKTTLGFASGLIKVASVLKGVLPVLAILGLGKATSAATEFGSGFIGGLKKVKDDKGGPQQSLSSSLGAKLAGGSGSGSSTDLSKHLISLNSSLSSNTSAISSLNTNMSAIAPSLQSFNSNITNLINSLNTLNNFSLEINNNTASTIANTSSIDALTTAILSIDFGSGPIPTIKDGGKILGFNRGGVVPGSGRGDKVPALLEPGEVVMNNSAVNKYGRGNLVRMNKYARGGRPYSVQELEPFQKTIISNNSRESNPKSNLELDDTVVANIIDVQDSKLLTRSEINLIAGQHQSSKRLKELVKSQEGRRRLIEYQKINVESSPQEKELGLEYGKAERLWGQGYEQVIINRSRGTLAKASEDLDYPIDLERISEDNNTFGEVKFKTRKEPTKKLVSKLLAKKILDNQTNTLFKEGIPSKQDTNINLGDLEYYSGISKDTQSHKLQFYQKFMAGSPGGIRVASGKGRGVEGSKGARSYIEPISSETYLKWAKGIYDEYDADPSLVMAAGPGGLRRPPEIALADMLLAQYALETGGAGLSVGQKFVRTPSANITDELRPYLVPDPSDPNELGFFQDDVVKFGKLKKIPQQVSSGISQRKTTSKMQRELFGFALEGVAKSVRDKTLTKKQLDTLSPDVLEALSKDPQSQVFSLPKLKPEVASGSSTLLDTLKGPLSEFRKSGGQTSLSGAIPEAAAKQIEAALPGYIDSVSDDSQKASKAKTTQKYFRSFIGGATAEKPGHATAFAETINQMLKSGTIQGLADGGIVQRFMAGGVTKAGSTDVPELLTDSEIERRLALLGGGKGIKNIVSTSKLNELVREKIRGQSYAAMILKGQTLQAGLRSDQGNEYRDFISSAIKEAEKISINEATNEENLNNQAQKNYAGVFGGAGMYQLGSFDTGKINLIPDPTKKRAIDNLKGPTSIELIPAVLAQDEVMKQARLQAAKAKKSDINTQIGISTSETSESIAKQFGKEAQLEKISQFNKQSSIAYVSAVADALDTKSNGSRIFLDFDKTLAYGADEIGKVAGSDKIDLSAFSDITKVKAGLGNAELSSLSKKLIQLSSEMDSKQSGLGSELLNRMFVVSARPSGTMPLISGWLNSKGLDIPSRNFVGVGGAGLSEADIAIEKAREIISRGGLGQGSVFIDDDPTNIKQSSEQGIISKQYGATMTPEFAREATQTEGLNYQDLVRQTLASYNGTLANAITINKQGQSLDFPNGLGPLASTWFDEPRLATTPTDVKRTITQSKVIENIANYLRLAKGYAFGGRADGPSFEDVRQQIIDKYPEIDFGIRKRKKSSGFGYNLTGALKATGGLSGKDSVNFQQPTNLKQLQEYSDKLASKLMNPEQLAVGGLLNKYMAGSPGGVSDKSKFTTKEQWIEEFKRKDKINNTSSFDANNNPLPHIDDFIKESLTKKPEKNFGQIALRDSGSRIQATYIKEGEAGEARSGQVIADKVNSSIYAVQSSSATKGYGPKLYDVVMEAATAAGGMLTSDRRTVSSAAKAVWAYYFNNRSDVNKTPLDPENWVSNSRLLDEKLYGPPGTWPQATDPAWILQSGYSKAPSDINDANLVQKLARGGSTNTVPAMVSNGEAFVPPQVAKKIGYAKLDKMNQADRNGMTGFAGGGISVFKGSGSGTSDSIGPIGLPTGSYILREKATKALSLSSGGPVGIQRFATGGTPAFTDDERSLVAARAKSKGISFDAEVKAIKEALLTTAKTIQDNQPKKDDFRATAIQNKQSLKDAQTTISTSTDATEVQQAQKIISDIAKDFASRLAEIDPSMSESERDTTGQQVAQRLSSGEEFSDILKTLPELTQAFDRTINDATALGEAQRRLEEETGYSASSLSSLAEAGELSSRALQKANWDKIENFTKSLSKAAFVVSGFSSILSSTISGIGGEENRGSVTASAGIQSFGTTAGAGLATISQVPGAVKGVIDSLSGMGGKIGSAASTIGPKIMGLLANPFTAAAALIGVAAVGIAAGFKEAHNAAREFDKALSAKNAQNAMDKVTQAFEEFANDMKALDLLDVIETQLTIAGENISRGIQIDAEVPKAMWVNLFDALTAGQSGNNRAESAQRSQILEKQGVGAYLNTSSTFMGQEAADANRSSYMRRMAPEMAQSQAASFKPVADATLRLFEDKLKTGTNLQDILSELKIGDAPSQLAENIARANPVIQEQILNIQASNNLDENSKKSIINEIIAREANYKSLLQLEVAQRQIDFEALNDASSRFVTSLQRMFDNMDRSINKTSFELEDMSRSAQLVTSSLSGQAQSGMTNLKSINVLQNQEAFSPKERASSVDQAAGLFGSGSEILRPMLQIAPKMEQTVLSTINNVLKRNPGANDEQIAGGIRVALDKALDDLGLPPDLSNKMSLEVQRAFSELRQKGDKDIGFDELAEKVPALGRSISSAKAAQEVAIRALEFFQKNINEYAQAVNTNVELQVQANDLLRKTAQIQYQGQLDLKKAFGRTVSLEETRKATTIGIQSQTGGLTDPRDITRSILRLEDTRRSEQSMADSAAQQGPGGMDEFVNMQDRLGKTNVALRENYDALKQLADSGELASAALSKIDEVEKKRAAGISIIEKLVTSDAAELNKFSNAMARLQNNMAGNANFGTSAEQRGESLQAFNMIAPMLGDQQGALKANVLESMLKESGVGVDSTMQEVLNSLRNPEGDPQMQEAINVYKEGVGKQAEANSMLAKLNDQMSSNNAEVAANKLSKALVDTKLSFESQQLLDINNNITGLRDEVKQNRNAGAPGLALGGMVYASEGQQVQFKSRGTDTVPAMLTPGEFVVNRSATAKNLPLLQNINNGYSKGGKVSYYQDGGVVVGPSPYAWIDKLQDSSRRSSRDELVAYSSEKISGFKDTNIITDNLGIKNSQGDDIVEKRVVPLRSSSIRSSGDIKQYPAHSIAVGKNQGAGRFDPYKPSFGVDTQSVFGYGPDSISVMAGGPSSQDSLNSILKINGGSPSSFNPRRSIAGLGAKVGEQFILPDVDNGRVLSKDKDNVISGYEALIKKLEINAKAISQKDQEPPKVSPTITGASRWGEPISINNLTKKNTTGKILAVDSIDSLLTESHPNLIGFRQDTASGTAYAQNFALETLRYGTGAFLGELAEKAAGSYQTRGSTLDTSIVSGPSLMQNYGGYNNYAGLLEDKTLSFSPAAQSNSSEISKIISQADRVKGSIKESIDSLKADKFTDQSERDVRVKDYFARLEELYNNNIFEASFEKQLPFNRGGIEYPIKLYNIKDKNKWQSMVKDSYNGEDAKAIEDENKGLLSYNIDDNYIPLSKLDQAGNITSTKHFPWTSPEATTKLQKRTTDAKGSFQKDAVLTSTSEEKYTGLGSHAGIFDFPYTKITGQKYNPTSRSWENKTSEYLAVSNSGGDKNPFSNLDGEKIYFDNMQTLTKILNDNTPLYDVATQTTPPLTKGNIPYEYPFQKFGAGSSGKIESIPGLETNEIYKGLNNSVKPFVLSSDFSNISDFTLNATKFKEDKEKRIKDFAKTAREQRLETAQTQTLSKKEKALTPDVRIAMAQAVRDAAMQDADIQNLKLTLNKPTDINQIASLASGLNSVQTRLGTNQKDSRWRTLDSWRSLFSTLYKPDQDGNSVESIAKYFKTFGVNLKTPKDAKTTMQSAIKNIILREKAIRLAGTVDGSIAETDLQDLDFKGGKLYRTRTDPKTGKLVKEPIQEAARSLPTSYADVETIALTPENIFPDDKIRSTYIDKLTKYFVKQNYPNEIITSSQNLKKWYGTTQDRLINEQLDEKQLNKSLVEINGNGAIKTDRDKYQIDQQLISGTRLGELPDTMKMMDMINSLLEDKNNPQAAGATSALPTKLASGGMVYASKGKYINFQPKGTDTVPAMLTPGEFVVNSAATQQNLPLLRSINSGSVGGYSKGGIDYLDSGGLVKKDKDAEDPYANMNPLQKQLATRKAEYQAQQKAKRESFRTSTGRDPQTGRIGGEKTTIDEDKQKATTEPSDPATRAKNEAEAQNVEKKERSERMSLSSIRPENRSSEQKEHLDILRTRAYKRTSEQLKRLEDLRKLRKEEEKTSKAAQSALQIENLERSERFAVGAIDPEARTPEQKEKLDILKTPQEKRTESQSQRLNSLRTEKRQRDAAARSVPRGEKLFGEFYASTDGNDDTYSNLTPDIIFKDLRATGESPLGYSSLSLEDRDLANVAIDKFINDYEKGRVKTLDDDQNKRIEDIKSNAKAIRMEEAAEALGLGIVSYQDLGLKPMIDAVVGEVPVRGDNEGYGWRFVNAADNETIVNVRSLTADEMNKLRKKRLEKQFAEIDARSQEERETLATRAQELAAQRERIGIRDTNTEALDAIAKKSINPQTKQPYTSDAQKTAVEQVENARRTSKEKEQKEKDQAAINEDQGARTILEFTHQQIDNDEKYEKFRDPTKIQPGFLDFAKTRVEESYKTAFGKYSQSPSFKKLADDIPGSGPPALKDTSKLSEAQKQKVKRDLEIRGMVSSPVPNLHDFLLKASNEYVIGNRKGEAVVGKDTKVSDGLTDDELDANVRFDPITGQLLGLNNDQLQGAQTVQQARSYTKAKTKAIDNLVANIDAELATMRSGLSREEAKDPEMTGPHADFSIKQMALEEYRDVLKITPGMAIDRDTLKRSSLGDYILKKHPNIGISEGAGFFATEKGFQNPQQYLDGYVQSLDPETKKALLQKRKEELLKRQSQLAEARETLTSNLGGIEEKKKETQNDIQAQYIKENFGQDAGLIAMKLTSQRSAEPGELEATFDPTSPPTSLGAGGFGTFSELAKVVDDYRAWAGKGYPTTGTIPDENLFKNSQARITKLAMLGELSKFNGSPIQGWPEKEFPTPEVFKKYKIGNEFRAADSIRSESSSISLSGKDRKELDRRQQEAFDKDYADTMNAGPVLQAVGAIAASVGMAAGFDEKSLSDENLMDFTKVVGQTYDPETGEVVDAVKFNPVGAAVNALAIAGDLMIPFGSGARVAKSARLAKLAQESDNFGKLAKALGDKASSKSVRRNIERRSKDAAIRTTDAGGEVAKFQEIVGARKAAANLSEASRGMPWAQTKAEAEIATRASQKTSREAMKDTARGASLEDLGRTTRSGGPAAKSAAFREAYQRLFSITDRATFTKSGNLVKDSKTFRSELSQLPDSLLKEMADFKGIGVGKKSTKDQLIESLIPQNVIDAEASAAIIGKLPSIGSIGEGIRSGYGAVKGLMGDAGVSWIKSSASKLWNFAQRSGDTVGATMRQQVPDALRAPRNDVIDTIVASKPGLVSDEFTGEAASVYKELINSGKSADEAKMYTEAMYDLNTRRVIDAAGSVADATAKPANVEAIEKSLVSPVNLNSGNVSAATPSPVAAPPTPARATAAADVGAASKKEPFGITDMPDDEVNKFVQTFQGVPQKLLEKMKGKPILDSIKDEMQGFFQLDPATAKYVEALTDRQLDTFLQLAGNASSRDKQGVLLQDLLKRASSSNLQFLEGPQGAAYLEAALKKAKESGKVKGNFAADGVYNDARKTIAIGERGGQSTRVHELAHFLDDTTGGFAKKYEELQKIVGAEKLDAFLDGPEYTKLVKGLETSYNASEIKKNPRELFTVLNQAKTDERTAKMFSESKEAEDILKQLMAAKGYNTGGLVYANKGQLINFQPRGTDTVPAMLTPGEFVINRDSSSKYRPVLEAINNGNYSQGGIVSYLNNGGIVNPDYYRRGGQPTGSSGSSFDFAGFMQNLAATLISTIPSAIQKGFQNVNSTPSQQNTSNGVSFDSSILDKLNEFTNRLKGVADTLASLQGIPAQITVTGQHDINVVINGDSALNQLKPELQNLVMDQVKDAFQRLVESNRPVPSNQLNNPFTG